MIVHRTKLQMGLTFEPATTDRWADLTTLFGTRGACGGCWCMAWRRSAKDFNAGKGLKNRNALRRLIGSGAPVGVIGYAQGQPVGWCSVSPRTTFERLEASTVLRPLDDAEVWSVSCLFVAKEWRRRGVSVALLGAAARYAKRCGARLLEGYPVVPKGQLPAPFVWTGTLAAFEAAGFTEAGRHSPARPIVRLDLTKLRGERLR